MPVPLGNLARFGLAKETNYGTKNTTGLVGVPFQSESIRATIEPARVEGMFGKRWALSNLNPPARMSVSGDLELPLIMPTPAGTDAMSTILEVALGSKTTSGTPQTTTFTIADNLPSFTLVLDRNTYNASSSRNYFIYSGCKVGQVTISGEENNVVRMRLSINGQKEELDTTAPTLTISTPSPALFWFSRVTLNDGTPTTITVRSFEITINHNLQTDRYFNNVLDLGASNPTITPNRLVAVVKDLPEGITEVSGNMELYFDSTKWYEKFLSCSSVSVTLKLASQYIASSVPTLTITLPSVRFTGETPSVGNAGPLNLRLNFNAYAPDTSTNIITMTVANET